MGRQIRLYRASTKSWLTLVVGVTTPIDSILALFPGWQHVQHA